MKTLAAQKLRYEDYAILEDVINDLIWNLVFKPVVAVLKKSVPKNAMPKELKNAKDDALKAALKSGAVQMVTEKDTAVFILAGGKSNREIADSFHSFGASLNKTRGAYTCKASLVPGWVRQEAASYTMRSKEAHAEVKKVLNALEGKIDKAVSDYNLEEGTDHAVKSVDSGWKQSAKSLEVVPELNKTGQDELSRGLAKTMKEVTIKDFAHEMIEDLREKVELNAEQGFRAEGLTAKIRDTYGVSKSRANLIAQTETSTFMSSYRAARAKQAGAEFYIWRCSNDSRTRPLHKKLDGHKFRYDNPTDHRREDRVAWESWTILQVSVRRFAGALWSSRLIWNKSWLASAWQSELWSLCTSATSWDMPGDSPLDSTRAWGVKDEPHVSGRRRSVKTDFQ